MQMFDWALDIEKQSNQATKFASAFITNKTST